MIAKPLSPLTAYNQFILYNDSKHPINYKTLQVCNAHDSQAWADYETIEQYSQLSGYGIGFVFTDEDPFFFLDIDGAWNGSEWSPVALELIRLLPDAAVEVSRSQTGLHIIGSYSQRFEHACKNIPLHIELYTSGRYVALTQINATGDASTDLTQKIQDVAGAYFPVNSTTVSTEWTFEPVAEWNGETDDEKLIEKILSTTGAGAAFSMSATFRDLWEGNADQLSTFYPHNEKTYDESSADAALAQHLAFWTGKNCERIRELMKKSGLYREKYERPDYLYRTILRCVSQQTEVYTAGGGAPTEETVKLKASSKKQLNYALKIRHKILAECKDSAVSEKLSDTKGPAGSAKFWIDNKDKNAEELSAMLEPVRSVTNPFINETPLTLSGFQYLSGDMQIEYFKGCVYIQDIHRIFTPEGSLLKSEQFNAVYGGYVFQLDENGDKTTRKAWEAFTESQVVRFPKVVGTCFKPDLEPGAIIKNEGLKLVNVYVPVEIEKIEGDPAPFLKHLKKILPDKRDRNILIAYMAACVQHKGVKFQWAPLLQGAEGNGKTLFTRCVAKAIGKKYTHYPKASDIDNKFNSWLLNKLFIGVEDIYVPDNRREIIETLKPMITGGDGLEIQMKGVDQITADVCANFILNSNHRDAIRKTETDRRFCVFYTAQQEAGDLIRDGMSGDYFPNLYKWLNSEGYKIVSNYLYNYKIPDELNPATDCHRAPETSTTHEAIEASLGSIEQEILDAIDEQRIGFAGGWVSSMALDRLLKNLNAQRKIPINKRRELLKTLGYDWHPGLKNGRVNNYVKIDGGKPKLFIKRGHMLINLTNGAVVVEEYEKAQNVIEGGVADAIFKIN